MERRKLPGRRHHHMIKTHIGNQSFFLGFGEYEDGTLGEVWLDTHKTGTFTRGIVNTLCRVISMALQYGVPVQDFVEIMENMQFPPNGQTDDAKEVASVVDWIAREMRDTYMKEDLDASL